MPDQDFADGVRFRIGNGGWIAVDGLALPGLLYLRVRDQGGQLKISEFYIEAGDNTSLTKHDLTSVPLTQIESAINSGDNLATAVRSKIGYASPDLATLASHFAWGVGSEGPTIRAMHAGNWAVSSIVSQSLPPEVSSRTYETEEPHTGKVISVNVSRVERLQPPGSALRIRKTDREFRLHEGQRPHDGLTDEWLTLVKRAYDAAELRGERPNASIRDQLGGKAKGVELKTVQMWVFRARQRGIMPPKRQKLVD